jgi:hypothetical protein
MLQERRRSRLRSPTSRMGSRRAVRCSLHCRTYQIQSQRKNTDWHLNGLLEVETTASLSDALRTKSCTGPVAGAGIVRGSEERNVVFDLVGCEAGCVLEAAERADAREDRVRLGLSAKRIMVDLGGDCRYLSTTVTRQSVVPEALVRSFDRSLVIVMTVGVGRAHKSSGGEGEVLHDYDENEEAVVIC